MKTTIRNLGLAGAAGFVLAAGQMTYAQTAVDSTTTVTSTAGTISQFDPNAIVIKSETSSEPIRYRFSKTTTYVDEAGNPVSVETVKSGVPVTVFYDRSGDDMVARKVVVRRAVTRDGGAVVQREERSTTTAGTISEFGPQEITVKSESSESPISYRYTKTTTYVDEAGNPVSMETVKSGLPVTVYYDRDGDAMVARKVIVRRAITNPEGGAVIEHKKTTTTTTEER